jgi:hypothetical protein
MARKFPEPVSATMLRMKDNDEIIFIRQKTEIQFGSSNEIIGSAFLTNPGSFEFKHAPGWKEFKGGLDGDWDGDRFDAVDYADLTMRNIIKVIREGYFKAGLGAPNGKLKIYNLSNIVQPKGEAAEEYHNKAYRFIELHPARNISELIEPVITKKEVFLEECRSRRFVIMGFVDGVFKKEYNQIIEWAKSLSNVVTSVDKKGRYSHPRRWQTEGYLNEAAIQKMEQILGACCIR